MEKSAASDLLCLTRLAKLIQSGLAPALPKAALTILADGLKITSGAIFLYNPEKNEFCAKACTGAPLSLDSISGQVLKKCLNSIIAQKDAGLSLICAPLRHNSQTFGAIAVKVCGHDGDANDYPDNLVATLEIAAGLLAPALDYMNATQIVDKSQTRPPGFVGSSAPIRQLYDQIAMVAPALTTVFLQGESGTGKELAARAIHEGSPRAKGPFISLNCAALPESLIESELFGHERGAFTGAHQTRRGRFELASGGTLFLDEIGELAPIIQAKLLRVLQERVFERLGGTQPCAANARVIAATNRNLASMVEDGSFRRDLFYRLNVFPIYLPPLRERKEDIGPLAVHFLAGFSEATSKKAPRLSLEALRLLENYEWPGNVRELQNVMERANLLRGSCDLIMPEHLADALSRPDTNSTVENCETWPSMPARIAAMEEAAARAALSSCGGKINQAAALLGITVRALGLRLKKYHIDYREYRPQKDN